MSGNLKQSEQVQLPQQANNYRKNSKQVEKKSGGGRGGGQLGIF